MYDFLQAIRNFELDKVIYLLPDQGKLLEIGSGAGWQAKRFSETGYEVEAVDIEISRYRDARVWPVTEYDGHHLPFPDNSFDIIYSSSVLEHIQHLEEFQYEIHRVLKPSGKVLHVLPSPTWRIWTSLAHYPYLLKTAIIYMYKKLRDKNNINRNTDIVSAKKKYTRLDSIRHILYSVRHGERGTALSEIYYFSRLYWLKLFRKTNWNIVSRIPMRITYSGYCVGGTMKLLRLRQVLSYFIGSSTIIYILEHNK